MAEGKYRRVVDEIRRVVDDASDEDLLDRFVRERDESAFAGLQQRYARLVYQVCWRALHHHQDVEDAFQATFVILALKAGSIRKRTSLASWLHGVAYHTAVKARAKRRVPTSAEVESMPAREESVDPAREQLDAAIEHLPSRYREPVVLCYLQGMTNAEAAETLGCPPGTVFGRLSRARDMLRDRLTRQGVALSAAALAALLEDQARAGTVPAVLSETTVQQAIRVAAGASLGSLASARVASLVKATVRAMTITRMKPLAFLLLGAVVCLGVGWFAAQPAANASAATATKPDDKKSTGLAEELAKRRDWTLALEWNDQQSNLEIFPDGFGVLNRKTQFQLTDADRTKILDEVQAIQFFELPKLLGVTNPGHPDARPECAHTIRLQLGAKTHEVVQGRHGAQSKEFARLAEVLRTAAETAAKKGTSVAGLQEGLEKVKAKELSAYQLRAHVDQTLEVEKPKQPGPGGESVPAGAAASRWYLSINGPVVEAHRLANGKYERRLLTLSDDDLRAVATTMIDCKVWDFPTNIVAPSSNAGFQYDFRVLDQEVRLKGGSHGKYEPIPNMDKYLKEMRKLNDRVMKDGELMK